MMSDWYRRLFPTRLSPGRQAVSEFETTAQGCWLATSVGGVLTGRGADVIIIDDPLKPRRRCRKPSGGRRTSGSTIPSTLASATSDEVGSC
jgi:hypothetical protein